MTENACQVDFYLLRSEGLDSRRLACRLSLMAWERGQHVTVVTDDEKAAGVINELMWEYPSGRFLPHEVNEGFDGGDAPVSITAKGDLNPDDVVINLSRQPIQKPGQFRRLLEIVPQSGPALEASRDKFRYYRDQGFEPATHEIKK